MANNINIQMTEEKGKTKNKEINIENNGKVFDDIKYNILIK